MWLPMLTFVLLFSGDMDDKMASKDSEIAALTAAARANGEID